MAAGQGFKTFTTGEVLTAADVNGYLMQGVLVFASEAARDAAITSPQEGQFAYTKDNNSLWYYTGSAWAASGATGDIEGVTAGVGISGGGTSGTVTVTNSMATAIDAKGDLVPGTGADTFARLAVGANGTILTADSAEATGLKWATPAASGSGLTLVKSQTIGSAVSSVTVTDAFSSTYDNYLITLNGGAASTDINIRLTLGATTSGYYSVGIYQTLNSSTVNGILDSNLGFTTCGSGTSEVLNGQSILQNPNLAKKTLFKNQGVGIRSGLDCLKLDGFIDTTTQYTAFTLTASSGTMTGGTVRVYGYQNS